MKDAPDDPTTKSTIIYHVTVSIARAREDEWRQWMREAHIPDVLNAGYFRSASMQRQLEPPPPEGSNTYHIRYECASLADLQAYQREAAPALQAEHTTKFQGDFTASRVIAETHTDFTR